MCYLGYSETKLTIVLITIMIILRDTSLAAGQRQIFTFSSVYIYKECLNYYTHTHLYQIVKATSVGVVLL